MNSEQLSAIKAELETVIGNVKEQQLKAMSDLELLNPTTEQYNDASTRLGISTYVLVVLLRIKIHAEKGDAKQTENAIRFTSHQIEFFGTPYGFDAISLAQRNLKHILNNLKVTYLD